MTTDTNPFAAVPDADLGRIIADEVLTDDWWKIDPAFAGDFEDWLLTAPPAEIRANIMSRLEGARQVMVQALGFDPERVERQKRRKKERAKKKAERQRR